MAKINNLKFYINPILNPTTHEDNTALENVASNPTYTTDGVLVFDEVAKLLYVKGIAYGLSATQASNLSTAVSDIATLKGSVSTTGSVLKIASDTADSKLAAALGTLTSSLATGAEDATVASLISSLQTQITSLSTTVGNNATAVSEGYVARSNGTDDFANTADIHTAISNAQSNAESAAAADAASKDSNLKSSIEGLATAGKTIPVTTGTGEQAVTTPETFTGDHKTLGYLWDRLADAYAKIDTLGGKDLAEVQAAISAIKAELRDDSAEGNLANTIIDKLANFLNSKTSWTVNGVTGVSNVEGIITQLETEISNASAAAAAAHSTVGATGDYITVTSATGASGAQNYTISTTQALDTAISTAASNAANNVVSWSIIGETESGS